jgi:hypothetical protein
VALANLTHRVRQQAGSYRFAHGENIRGCLDRVWGALGGEKYPRMTLANLSHRVRQQAGSYRFAHGEHFRGYLDRV